MPSRPHYVANDVKTMTGSTLKICATDLNIIWGNDNRYWRSPDPKTGSAELLQVCWLEVNGVVNVKPGRYKISFSVTLEPDSFGWNGCTPYVMAKVGNKGHYTYGPAKLPMYQSSSAAPIVVPNEDLVIEVPREGSSLQQIHFGFYEIWSGKWKGGLELHHALIELM